MGEFLAVAGFIVGLFVVIDFFVLVSHASAIRRGMVALEQQAAEQTRYLAAISVNMAKQFQAASHAEADGQKS
jgi:hypothetical protein